jgi:peptidoglycan L-alanyl-D-glutamate endopeptidase CwlK
MDQGMAEKLGGVAPEVVEKVRIILEIMARLGHPMVVTDGLRTIQQQQDLYAQGRTRPGKIVTQCDGVVNKSNHQSGRAVDCTFLLDGRPHWPEKAPWRLYGEIAKALGFAWGGDWPSRKIDRPHIELP